MKWNTNKWQLIGLALYSSAFPLGIYLENQFHVPYAFLISLINLPFLVILGPLLMGAGPLFHGNSHLLFYFLAWTVIFAQSYLAFIFLRRRAEKNNISSSKALMLSLGRLGVISFVTLVIGGLALVLVFRIP